MKKKLALLLTAAMCATCLFTGCGEAKTEGSSTEKGSESSTTAKGEIKDLYVKGEYEELDLSAYITLGDYAGLITLKESDYTVSQEEIQEVIDGYRESYGTTEEVKDRTVQKGDIVNIDYVGRINGVKFVGGTAQDYDLEIGSGTFIAGFEDGLIGAAIDQTLEVKATFPENYTNDKELAGKEAVFTVTINTITVPVPAEYNDELVKKISKEQYATTAEFEAALNSELTLSKAAEVLDKFVEELAKKSTFTEKVDELAETKNKEMIEYYESYAKAYGYTLEKFATAMGFSSEEVFRETVKKDAVTEVKNYLTVYAYAKAIGFSLTDEQVLETAKSIADLYGFEDVETLLGQYEAVNVRAEAFNERIAEIVVNNYK